MSNKVGTTKHKGVAALLAAKQAKNGEL